MNQSIVKCTVSGVLTLGLLGCGGGGGVSVDPQSSSGFAEAGDAIVAGTAFTTRGVTLAQVPAGETTVPTLTSDTISITSSADGGTLVITSSDNSFSLTSDGDGTFSDIGSADDSAAFFSPFVAGEGVVETGFLELVDADGNYSFGFVTFGFDTDPDTIAQISGDVTYSGAVALFVDSDGDFAGGTGAFDLAVDFDSNAVSGNILIEDAGFGTGAFSIPTTNLTLVETSIDENGFSGEFTADLTGSEFDGLSLNNASYDGQFFGSDAEAVGGSLSATLQDADGDDAFSIVGGFNGGQ